MIENLYGEARGTDSEDSANPSELSVVAQLANLASPYAIRVAATLRLADLIEAEPRRLDELAAAAGANPDALGRLMRFLTCRAVFAEPEPDVFSMTESARVLTSNHPMQVRGWFDLDGLPPDAWTFRSRDYSIRCVPARLPIRRYSAGQYGTILKIARI